MRSTHQNSFFAYFGLDPAVKQSGNFNGTKISMSKRGSRIARRVIHTMALISISKNKDGSPQKSSTSRILSFKVPK
ncbi:transposase [Clostridium sp. KNHs214]|uniref:transposase n=1 Tax=Clostridium sp. KNHs214 TaxID=1540257 RepID=UPI0025710C03|nr:transposase [Clostridium sp. KNHs214]